MSKKNYQFEINSIIVFGLNMVANVVSYLFQIILARMVTIKEYGYINFVFSILIISTIPASIIGIVSCKKISEAISLDDKVKEVRATRMGTVIYLIIAPFVGISMYMYLTKYFGYSGSIGLIVALNTFFAGLSSLVLCFLQGKQYFYCYGFINILVYIIRLLGSIVIVTLNWNINLIFVNTIIAWILSVVIIGLVVRKKEIGKDIDIPRISFIGEWKIWKYELRDMCLANIGLQILMNMDNILVKKYLDNEAIGYYSSANTIARIAMYITNATVVVMFPKIVSEQQERQKRRATLKKTIIYGIGSAIAIFIFIFIFSDYIITRLYGENYLYSAQILVSLFIYVIPLTLLAILVNYASACNKSKTTGVILLFCFLLQLVLVNYLHSSINEIIRSMSVVTCIADAAILLYLLLIRRNIIEDKNEKY